MSMIIETSDGPLEIGDFAISAVARQAERQADLVAAFLKALGVFPEGKPICLPPGYLLELGAALQLGYWEQQGISLPPGAPNAKEAMGGLVAKVYDDPTGFSCIADAELAWRVLAIWLKSFSWEAQTVLEADLTISEVNEDAVVEALAQLLWRHRNDPAMKDTAEEESP